MTREQAEQLARDLSTAVWNVEYLRNTDNEQALSYWQGRLEALQSVNNTLNFTELARD